MDPIEQSISPPTPSPGRIAGIDYGTVRIGVALSDPGRTFAGPYENYNRRTPKLDDAWFLQFVQEERITRLVIGLPVHLHGGESEKSMEARKFGLRLQELTGLQVDYFDERFTSKEAERHLLDAGLTKKRRQKRLDMLAAQIMLQAYLDAGARSQDNPGGLDDRD